MGTCKVETATGRPVLPDSPGKVEHNYRFIIQLCSPAAPVFASETSLQPLEQQAPTRPPILAKCRLCHQIQANLVAPTSPVLRSKFQHTLLPHPLAVACTPSDRSRGVRRSGYLLSLRVHMSSLIHRLKHRLQYEKALLDSLSPNRSLPEMPEGLR